MGIDSESSFFQVTSSHRDESVECLQLHSGARQHLFYKLYHDGRYYFLKSLCPAYLQQEFYREVLRKEYELGKILQSEYIVNYHELTDTPAECSLLMDYVNGVTLDDFVRLNPDYFSQSDNLRKFLRQLCMALHELHSHQALHLDLKPSNIMLTSVNNDVRLIDLGCCYMDARPDLTGQTDDYAAPEQLDGSNAVDARTDIYAMGRILEQLSIHQPFFQKIAYRCMKKHKEDRFQTVDEILQQLDENHSSKHSGNNYVYYFIAVCMMIVIFTWRCISKTTTITDGTTFVDTSCNDTLYLRVLSVADRSLAVEPSPEGGHPYTGDLVMPDSVVYRGETFFIRELDDNALRGCSLVTNIHFPPTLTTIRNSALRNCSGITSLHLPPALRHLYYEPFASCTNLSYVNWPTSATEVPRNCFVACCSLREIILPEGVTTIHQDAFTSCSSLEKIVLPSTLERIDRGAFYDCRSLHNITLPANVKVLGEYLFYECPTLQEIRVLAPQPPTISVIVDKSFQGIVRVPASSIEAYRKATGWNRLPLLPFEP